MMMRRRGPGLIGTMARTAVIAGTATAVSGAVAGKQQQKMYEQQLEAQQQMAAQQQAQAAAAAPAPAPAPDAAAPAGGDELIAQLTKLGELKAAGILTDEEFAAAKAKLLG